MNISRNCCFYPFSYCLPPIRTHPTITKYISNSNIIDDLHISVSSNISTNRMVKTKISNIDFSKKIENVDNNKL